MSREWTYKTAMRALPLLGLLGLFASTASIGQVPVDDNGNPLTPIGAVADLDENGDVSLLSAPELEALVGPVALYPDDLLAIVLPASTYPLEIVQAARFLEALEGDSSLTPDEDWDDSVVALLNYPEVVKMMNDDLDWTWRLGEAVIAQQSDLVAAVEVFRDRAYTAGNLKSDQYQTVTRNDSVIEIAPVREEVIYVPYYEPERVIVYSPSPVYYYYPRAYPLYYYPYASDYHFDSGFFWGVTTAFSIGWASDYLHVYHHSYRGHRYHGRSYYGHHYRRPSIHRYNNYYVNNHRHSSYDNHRNGDYWRPRHRGGARPGNHGGRDNYYSGGGRGHHNSGNRNSGSRNHRDRPNPGLAFNGNGQRSPATPGNSRLRGDGSAQRGSGNGDRGRNRNRGSVQAVASERSSGGPGNRSGRSSSERPAMEFRQRPNTGYRGTATPRPEAGRSSGRPQYSNRSAVPSGNPNAERFRDRESSPAPRITARQSTGSRVNTAASGMYGRAASGGNRSHVAASTPGFSAARMNRHASTGVSVRPPQAQARPQTHHRSSGRAAASSFKPYSKPSQSRSQASVPGESRSTFERGSSSKSSSSSRSNGRPNGSNRNGRKR